MLLGELQGVDHAQHLVDVAAQGQVVDHLVAHVAGLIDEEGAAEGDLGFRVLHVVGLADAVVDVGHQRVFTGPMPPSLMAVVRQALWVEYRKNKHPFPLHPLSLKHRFTLFHPDHAEIFPKSPRTTLKIRLLSPISLSILIPRPTNTLSSQYLAAT